MSVDLKILDGAKEVVISAHAYADPRKFDARHFIPAATLRMQLNHCKTNNIDWFSIIPVRRLILGCRFTIDGVSPETIKRPGPITPAAAVPCQL